MWEAPHIRWAQSHTRELLPSARVSRGDTTTVLPRRPRDLAALRFDHAGREWTLAAAMEQTDVEGCMVIHDGAIVFEHYAGGRTAAASSEPMAPMMLCSRSPQSDWSSWLMRTWIAYSVY